MKLLTAFYGVSSNWPVDIASRIQQALRPARIKRPREDSKQTRETQRIASNRVLYDAAVTYSNGRDDIARSYSSAIIAK